MGGSPLLLAWERDAEPRTQHARFFRWTHVMVQNEREAEEVDSPVDFRQVRVHAGLRWKRNPPYPTIFVALAVEMAFFGDARATSGTETGIAPKAQVIITVLHE